MNWDNFMIEFTLKQNGVQFSADGSGGGPCAFYAYFLRYECCVAHMEIGKPGCAVISIGSSWKRPINILSGAII